MSKKPEVIRKAHGCFSVVGLFLAGYNFLICDHVRAVHLYISALSHPCPIVGFPCASHQDFLNGHCLDCAEPFLSSCPRIGTVPAWELPGADDNTFLMVSVQSTGCSPEFSEQDLLWICFWEEWETVLFSDIYEHIIKAHILPKVEQQNFDYFWSLDISLGPRNVLKESCENHLPKSVGNQLKQMSCWE